MDEKLGVDCDCGFSMTTPHGQDDAVAVVQLHIQRIHPDIPATRETALSFIKKR